MMRERYSERMLRRSIMYAMLGLFFGCLSAGLIVVLFRPVLRTVVERRAWMDQDGHVTEVRTMETHWLRGRRRLTDITKDDLDLGGMEFGRRLTAMIAPSPTTASPTSSPTNSPTSAPTQDPNTETVSSGGSSTTTLATETIAAAMVGVASSIIVCALLLYASDVRDRYRHEKWNKEHQQDVIQDDNSSQKSACRSRTGVEGESQTSAGSTTHTHAEESGYWVKVTTTSNELVEYEGATRPNMLPPMLADEARGEELNLALTRLPEDASISRVSTLTASLVEGGFSYADIEEKLSRHAIESSSDVTELSDSHRVPDDTNLASLIKGANNSTNDGVSVCSSLTNGSQSTARLLGEECLDVKYQQTPDATPLASLEVSPDTPHVMEDEDTSDEDRSHHEKYSSMKKVGNELAQLEHLMAGIPFDEMSVGTPAPSVSCETRNDSETREEPEDKNERDAFVRDVCFLATAEGGKAPLGLELRDALSADSYPTVAKVELDGPLVGRLFVGDAILAVNERETCGLSSEAVVLLFETGAESTLENDDMSERTADKMIKITVMSSESDGGSLSDGQQSVDLGLPDSAVEI